MTGSHTDTSRHDPGSAKAISGEASGFGQKTPLGCIIRTPFVVSPSTSPCEVSHFVAFSPEDVSQDRQVSMCLGKAFQRHLPKNIFLDESNPAAKTKQPKSSSERPAKMRQANREIVDWVLTASTTLLPGTVSMTTKSMGHSELRPIYYER